MLVNIGCEDDIYVNVNEIAAIVPNYDDSIPRQTLIVLKNNGTTVVPTDNTVLGVVAAIRKVSDEI